jgi:hypothetical protein
MKIYENEINDNLQEMIESKDSIAFVCDIVKDENPEYSKALDIVCNKDDGECSVTNKASAEKQQDLYYMNSVLVSAGWNKNDDVFSTQALWAARKTPLQKPFNYMHDETDIIGHMTDALVITEAGSVLSEENTTEANLPDRFDIVTSSVIYKSWSDPDMRIRIEELTQEIDEGKWSVSMECAFSDFDYAVITPDGQDKILRRAEGSSFLTKHLRAYGGSGEYEGYKLGRLLKGFYFSGKGLVEKPANPRSIIFSKDVDPFNAANGTVNFNHFITLRESSMTKALNEVNQVGNSAKADVDEAVLSSPNVETEVQPETDISLAEKVEKIEKAMETMANKFMEMVKKKKEEKMKKEKEEEEAKMKPKAEDASEAEEAKEDTVAETETVASKLHEEKIQAFEAVIQEKDSMIQSMQKELDEMKVSVATMSRKSILSEAGVNLEVAEKLIAKFSDASDEMFETVVELAKSQVAPITEELFEGEQENEVSASELEEAEDVVEPSMAEAGEGQKEVEMSSASEWLRNSVLKLTKNLKQGV